MIRVAVVDDQALVRMGLRVLLESEPDTELVGEAADGAAGVDLVRTTAPDVVLMDVRMPGTDGLTALRRITDDPALRDVRVVVLTTFELDEYVFEALAAGASGFVLKDGDPADLLRAIRVVADGGSLLSPSVTHRVIEQFASAPARRAAPRPGLDELTERELEVFRLIASGLSNAEIGETLFISDTTVKTHVTRVLAKLGLRDRVQAVVLAHQAGLFEAER